MPHIPLRPAALVVVFAALGAALPNSCIGQSTGSVRGTIAVAGGDNTFDLSRAIVFLGEHRNLTPRDRNRPSAQIQQRNKAFHPNLLAVAKGTAVEFPNRDPFSHNVFSRSPAAQFDLDRYGQGMSKRYQFDNVGLVQLFCNIHPQMRAVILVVPNRHFTRADAQGRFAIPGVPVGSYALVVWHEQAGATSQNVDVRVQKSSEVRVTVRPRQAGRPSRNDAPAQHGGNVTRGLGMKRERLDLPTVGDAHAAP
jgi:plastocyanin